LTGRITTAYSLANATTVEFDTAPANGVAIRIYRLTDIEAVNAVFYKGSSIRADDLNDNFAQTLYRTQETASITVTTDGGNPFVGNVDMGGFRLTNLGAGVAGTDGVTKAYVDQRYGALGVPGLTRWRKIATAGQTVFSGVGEDGNTLAYSASRESVFINGAYQQRGVDYTADDDSSITFTPALLVGDVVDVHCVNNVSGVATDQASGVYFTQSGVGALARTVDSKLKDMVSVKDFGAVGDGVTNDTTAIQAAFSAASGAPVLFPYGNYLYPGTYSLAAGQGAISYTDGAQGNVWLQSRSLSGSVEAGAGTLVGYSPTAFMWDTLEDCSVTGDPFFVGGRYRHRFGGSSVTGGRIGLYSSLYQTSGTSPSSTNRNYVALQGSTYCAATDNGTDTGANAKGAFFGGGFATYVDGAAQNLLNVTAAEFNTFISAGASVKYQFGLQIAGANAQKGTGFDAALSISGLDAYGITHAGYGIGILFSSANGANPFSATSTIIATSGAATVQGGIDFSSYTITGQIIQGAHSKLSESGLTIGDSGGFAIINGGSQSAAASLMLRPKGGGSCYIQNGDGSVTAARFDAGGAVIFPNLPTSGVGLPAGVIWNDAGTLKIA
jgi:hypothetical protein